MVNSRSAPSTRLSRFTSSSEQAARSPELIERASASTSATEVWPSQLASAWMGWQGQSQLTGGAAQMRIWPWGHGAESGQTGVAVGVPAVPVGMVAAGEPVAVAIETGGVAVHVGEGELGVG